MKCLLIGGAGFIGSWLTKYLTDKGFPVVIVDPIHEFGTDMSHIQKVRDFRNKFLLKKATIYKGRFEEIGEKIIKKEKPQIIIHLAGYPLEHSFDSPLSLKQLTEDSALTYQIVLAVKKYPIKKFIFLSSIASYGNFEFSINEKATIRPVTVYGVSKASGEFLTTSYLDNWVIIRSANVYGFADLHKRSVNTILNSALRNEKFWINDKAWLDFIYINDMVEGIHRTITHGPTKEIFHITGGNAQKLSSLIDYLHPHFKLKYQIKHLDKPSRGTMDNSKARMMLDWSPKMNLEKGIKDYLQYVKKYNFA